MKGGESGVVMVEKWEQAESDYLAGMKYKEIADKYDVTLNTVKSWKQRYGWARNGAPPKQKSVHTKTKGVHTNIEVNEAIDGLDDSSLADKQKAFVVEYLKSFNATQAYLNVFDSTYNTARTEGSKLLAKPNVQKAVSELRKARLKDLAVTEQDIIGMWAKQAFADIGDYVKFGGYDVMNTDSEGTPLLDVNDNPIILHQSFVQLKSNKQVDTSLIKKVTLGKDGPVIELHDQVRAQERLLEVLQGITTDDNVEDSSLIRALDSATESAFDDEDETET
ncbi:terminase small subunit [Weissella oryzae]|nr:terminase small subunit [Weissella oryzae]